MAMRGVFNNFATDKVFFFFLIVFMIFKNIRRDIKLHFKCNQYKRETSDARLSEAPLERISTLGFLSFA